MSLGAAIALSAFLTGLSGILVVVETAVLHIRRARAAVLAEEVHREANREADRGNGEGDGLNGGGSDVDRRRAMLLAGMLDDRVRSLAVVQLVVLASRLSAGAVLAVVVAERSGVGWAVVSVAVMVLVGAVLADAMPRVVALRALDRVVLRSAVIVAGLDRVAPLRWLAASVVTVAERLLPRTLRTGTPAVSEEELLAVAERAEESQAIDADERELIESVIAFGDTLVREVMVPRPDMGCVAAELSVADAMAAAATNGYSRIPVTGDGLDEIVGVVHAKDLMRAHLDGKHAEPDRR